MRVFGITGGSGSGKTSVSAVFKSLGVEIVDTDIIAREVVEAGSECLNKLVEYFGNEVLYADGTLNRKRLASIAFPDKEKTEMLNSITHKYIKERVEDILSHFKADFAAIDGAVIIGSLIEPRCEFIVSVIADRDVRIRRIMKRDGITDYQAGQRLMAQPDDAFYKSHSKFVILNNGTEHELENEVKVLFNKIKEV